MRRTTNLRNLLGPPILGPRIAAYLVVAAIAFQIARPAEADIEFGVRCEDGIGSCVLIPIIRPDQLLRAVNPPDPFPPIGPEPCLTCPPFIEIFDVPELDVAQFAPPPLFEARVRFGEPNPQPSITDSPNVPNLLLIYTGQDEIAGPAELGSFQLNLPPDVLRLQYYAQAFNAQGSPVANIGTIQIPEPSSALLLISGVAVAGCIVKRRWGVVPE